MGLGRGGKGGGVQLANKGSEKRGEMCTENKLADLEELPHSEFEGLEDWRRREPELGREVERE